MILQNFIDRIQAAKFDRHISGLKKMGLTMGKGVSIQPPFFFDPSHCHLISIGDNCTFAPDVRLIAHDASLKRLAGFTKIGHIRIGNNCFLGAASIVLCNVEIGDNCIIGAGAVVTKSIPANSIAAGNPARVIGNCDSYVEKHIQRSKSLGIFGREYQMYNLTAERKAEMIAALDNTDGYLV